MTDVLVKDLGVELVNGALTLTAGFETAAQLSLFGGNAEDNASAATATKQWWGNYTESDPVRMYRSRTQALLESLPATTGNLRALEAAAKFDLDWFLTSSAASSVDVFVTLPGVNRVAFAIKIEAQGVEHSFNFVQNWFGAAAEAASIASVIAENVPNAPQFAPPPFTPSPNCVQFDGFAQYMRTELTVLAAQTHTMSIWYAPTVATTLQIIATIGNDSNNINRILLIQESDGWSFKLYNSFGALFKWYIHTTALVNFDWYNIVYTFNGVTNTLRLWQDGEEIVPTKFVDTADSQTSTSRRIEYSTGSQGGNGNSRGYSLAFWDTDLTPGEVVGIYNNRTEADLNFAYPADLGTHPYDSVANLLHWYRFGFQFEPNIGDDYSNHVGATPIVSAGASPITNSDIFVSSPS